MRVEWCEFTSLTQISYLDGTPIAGFYVNHTLEYGFFWGTYIKVYGENTIFAPVTNNTNFVDPSKIDYRLVPNSPGWRKGVCGSLLFPFPLHFQIRSSFPSIYSNNKIIDVPSIGASGYHGTSARRHL